MLIFAHIPKAGGNSIFHNIENNYPKKSIIRYYARQPAVAGHQWWPEGVPHLDGLEDLPSEITDVRLLKKLKIKFISGHFSGFNQIAPILRGYNGNPFCSKEAKYFFALRNPVDMCASHYIMHMRTWGNFRRLGAPCEPRVKRKSQEKTMAIVEDWKTGWHLDFWLNSMIVRPLLFFSNGKKPDLALAIKRVKKASFIFDCDNFAGSFKKMQEKFNLKIKDYDMHLNTAKKEEYSRVDKKGFSDFVKKDLAEDLAFHEECKKISQSL